MNTLLKWLIIFTVLFLLQSCVSFKPSVFDNNTKRYNDYKNNYSIKILDGYDLMLSSSGKNDAVMFYNKNEKTLIMYAQEVKNIGSTKKKDNNAMIQKIMEYGYYGIKELSGSSTYAYKDIRTVKTDNDITVEFIIIQDIFDYKAIMKMVPYPLSTDLSHYGIYVLMSISKLDSFSDTKQDFLNMYKTLSLPAFSESERKND